MCVYRQTTEQCPVQICKPLSSQTSYVCLKNRYILFAVASQEPDCIRELIATACYVTSHAQSMFHVVPGLAVTGKRDLPFLLVPTYFSSVFQHFIISL